MTETTRMQLAMDGTGMIEVCDCCDQFIFNVKHWMHLSFLGFDGKIRCNDCRSELAKQVLTN